MRKRMYFEKFEGEGWPDPRALKPFFFAPSGQEWFNDFGNDTAGLRAESLYGLGALRCGTCTTTRYRSACSSRFKPLGLRSRNSSRRMARFPSALSRWQTRICRRARSPTLDRRTSKQTKNSAMAIAPRHFDQDERAGSDCRYRRGRANVKGPPDMKKPRNGGEAGLVRFLWGEQ
jgi:hypothetical protein